MQRGALRLPDLAPGATESVEIAGLNPEAVPGEEAYLTVSFETARELPWAPAGFPVGWQQVALADAAQAPVDRDAGAAGEAVEIDFDTENGLLTGIRLGGHSLLTTEPELSLWRRRHRQRRAQARAEPGTETARTLANLGSRPSHPLGRSRADQEHLRRHQHGGAGPLRRSRSRSGREDEHDVPEGSRRQRHGDRGHPHPGAVRGSAARSDSRSSCRPRSSTSPGSDAVRTSRIPIASAAPRSVGTTRP